MSNICLSTQRNFLVSFGVLDSTQMTHDISITLLIFNCSNIHLISTSLPCWKQDQSVFVGLKYHLKWQPQFVKLTLRAWFLHNKGIDYKTNKKKSIRKWLPNQSIPNPMCSMNSSSLQWMKNTQESMYKKTQWFQTFPCEACSYGWSPLWWRIEPFSSHPPAMVWHSPLNLFKLWH